jgi:pyocin large subunit-like protein
LAEVHTFLVGDGEWVVYNADSYEWAPTVSDSAKQNAQSHWQRHQQDFSQYKLLAAFAQGALDFATPLDYVNSMK